MEKITASTRSTSNLHIPPKLDRSKPGPQNGCSFPIDDLTGTNSSPSSVNDVWNPNHCHIVGMIFKVWSSPTRSDESLRSPFTNKNRQAKQLNLKKSTKHTSIFHHIPFYFSIDVNQLLAMFFILSGRHL